MKKFCKLLLVVMTIGVFFSTVETYAASKYYEYVWTNHYGENSMYYEDDIITNDVIEVEEGFLTVGFDHISNSSPDPVPRIRLLDETGKLIKEVDIDSDAAGRLKRIYQVGNKYYAFGHLHNSTVVMIVLDENYNVIVEEYFEDYYLELEDDVDTYVEYYNGNFYIFSPSDLIYGKMFKVSTSLYDGKAVYYSELTNQEKQYLKGYVNIANYEKENYYDDYVEYTYPTFITELSDGFLYGVGTGKFNFDTGEDGDYSFQLIKVDKNLNEVWTVTIDDYDFFVRDAIGFRGNILLNATDEYGNPSLITYDANGNRLEKDFISNYYSSEDNKTFWGEHLILLTDGFALTGSNMTKMEKPPQGEVGEQDLGWEVSASLPNLPDNLMFDAKVLYFHFGYDVYTKTDGNGTVTPSATNAYADDVITFVVTPNEGYKVGYVNVTDEYGNTVTFPGNTFTMPHADVTIEAAFLIDNPKTGNTTVGATAIGLLLASIPLLQSMKKKDKFYTV